MEHFSTLEYKAIASHMKFIFSIKFQTVKDVKSASILNDECG